MASCEPVELGFLDEFDDQYAPSPDTFPSKVGGKPVWLDPRLLPSSKSLECRSCKKPCVLLLQIYAPLSDHPSVYHRSLYVFMCRDPSCHKKGSSDQYRVFCCGLPKENDYYSNEDQEEDTNGGQDEEESSINGGEDDEESCNGGQNEEKSCNGGVVGMKISKASPTLCVVCGCRGNSHCSRCRLVHYCSKHHQLQDWRNGHKLMCEEMAGGKEVTNLGHEAGAGLLLRQFEIVTETEPEEEEEEEKSEEERMKDYHQLVNSSKYRSSQIASSSCGLEEAATSSDAKDESFLLFQKRTRRDPQQVLRYQRGGKPLLITSDPAQQPTTVPQCSRCGSDRVFEFQILPQLLYFLKMDSSIDEGVDWGTLLIYCCNKDCQQMTSPNNAYHEEFIWKQDI